MIKAIKIFTIISFLFISFVLFLAYKVYSDTFRLNREQVVGILNTQPTCTKIAECNLLPGDILLRRYVTPVTKLFDKLINPYFTHSAFYIGEDSIFEALGNHKAPEDQVVISKLSESEWFDEEVEAFVILRPKKYSESLGKIIENLTYIANDPKYIFGFLGEEGTVSCSDIILKKLIDERVIDGDYESFMITPDYLFQTLLKNTESVEIVGYFIPDTE